jgi:hypothetical protein
MEKPIPPGSDDWKRCEDCNATGLTIDINSASARESDGYHLPYFDEMNCPDCSGKGWILVSQKG